MTKDSAWRGIGWFELKKDGVPAWLKRVGVAQRSPGGEASPGRQAQQHEHGKGKGRSSHAPLPVGQRAFVTEFLEDYFPTLAVSILMNV